MSDVPVRGAAGEKIFEDFEISRHGDTINDKYRRQGPANTSSHGLPSTMPAPPRLRFTYGE